MARNPAGGSSGQAGGELYAPSRITCCIERSNGIEVI